MTFNDILCTFYHLKEMADKDKNQRSFKYTLNYQLNDDDKNFYILERRNVYDCLELRSPDIDIFAENVERYSTFDLDIITKCLKKIMEAETGKKFISYAAPFYVPYTLMYGRGCKKNDGEQKICIVVTPEDNYKKPKSLKWFENNTHSYATDVGMATVAGTRVESPRVPSIFDYIFINDILCLQSLGICRNVPDSITFYSYNGYEIFKNCFGISLKAEEFINDLIALRMMHCMQNMSYELIEDFCNKFINTKIRSEKDIKNHNVLKRKINDFQQPKQ